MKDTLFEFRCWLNDEFRVGRFNNLAEVEHLIDCFYKHRIKCRKHDLNEEVKK
jgi:hypothetical protein